MYINGQAAPIVGNVCMDMCMIDITNIPCEEGDDVVVFDREHPITELAEASGTIPYEVLTNVSRRVKRVYYQE
jgi:alanine racemase